MADLNLDYILIDCPPSLNILTINSLVAAQSVLVPLQTEFFALEGLSQLLQTVERIRARFNPERSEEHTSELQSRQYLVCRLLLEKKKNRQLPAPTALPLPHT